MTLLTSQSSLSSSWERRLLALALEPFHHDHPVVPVVADAESLERAYEHCDAVTREHSKTFYLASALMPPAKRRAVRALYAFCRISDDLVDVDRPGQDNDDRLSALEMWRNRALLGHLWTKDAVALA